MASQQHTQNQIMQNRLVQVAQALEAQVDEQIAELNELDDDEIDRIREKRKAEMKKLQDIRQQWKLNGHGKLNEINSDKDFFTEAKNSKKVIVHFYRNTTMRCKLLDEHLKKLAAKHMETKFIKLDVEKCNWIVDRLNIKILPTLAFIKDGKTTDYLRGFDRLGGTDDFSTEMLEWRMGQAGIITYKGDLNVCPDNPQKSKGRSTRIIRGKQNEDSDSD